MMLKHLVPTPKKIEVLEGTLKIENAIYTESEMFDTLTGVMKDAVKKLFRVDLESKIGGIVMQYCENLPTNLYIFDSTGDNIVLKASSVEGMSYALATTLQAISASGGELTVERAVIEDYPEKDYRALMVDLARQWHPASTISRYIDVCFMLKMKYLHLHFIDSQSYTLPSRAFPNLNVEGRYYTYEDIENMRAYANARGITIIPEFEAPGHAKILNITYPEVFANTLPESADGVVIVTEMGEKIKSDNIICGGSKVTNDAVRTLLTEMCELFPETPYVHIGGDEANFKVWDYCPVCKQYMEKNNIADSHELYSEFVGRVARMAFELGKTPIVWEGFPKNGVHHVPKETIVIAWESHYHLAPDLLEEGFKIINASWEPMYIVPDITKRWGPQEIFDWGIYNWQHWYKVSAAYDKPITVEPTENVLGAQICSWESIYDLEINKIIVNLSALSERVWSTKRTGDVDEFCDRVNFTSKRIAQLIQEV